MIIKRNLSIQIIVKIILIPMKYMKYQTRLDMMIKHIKIIHNMMTIICIDKFLLMIMKKNYFFKVLIHLIMI
jgi:hypothetical protein